jgi:hypothetical protein
MAWTQEARDAAAATRKARSKAKAKCKTNVSIRKVITKSTNAQYRNTLAHDLKLSRLGKSPASEATMLRVVASSSAKASRFYKK